MIKINYGWYRSKSNKLYYRVFGCGIVLEVGGHGKSWYGTVILGNKRTLFSGKTLKNVKSQCESYIKECVTKVLEELDKW